MLGQNIKNLFTQPLPLLNLGLNSTFHWWCNWHDCYQGPHPFSEPESEAIRDHITAIRNNTLVAISVHAYGNVLIYPWGYTTTPHPDQARLARLANAVSKAIKTEVDEDYEPGTAYEVWVFIYFLKFLNIFFCNIKWYHFCEFLSFSGPTCIFFNSVKT